MLNPLSGKEKAARVPLDYFRRAGQGKWLVTLILLGVGLVVAGLSLASGAWRQWTLPGKVHGVHAAFEDNCASCHAPFQPSTPTNPMQTLLQTGPVADHLCQACHDGPPHHPTREVDGEVVRCASCHIEHRGRYSALSQSPDSTCTSCHGNLEKQSKDGKTSFAKEISIFSKHPQFQIAQATGRKPVNTATDPGKLKFNHQVHLSNGIRYRETDSRGWTLNDITDQNLRESYRKKQPKDKQADKDFIQLNCASCHNTDGPDAVVHSELKKPFQGAAGEYMLPVVYDQHCKACHPLTFRPDLPEIQIPHPLKPAEVNQFLWGVLAEKEVKTLQATGSSRPLPGENLSRLDKKARDSIQKGITQLESILYQVEKEKACKQIYLGKNACGLCHFDIRKPGQTIPDQIVPTNVPEVWYPHGKFSHLSHRAVQCLDCHNKANESITQVDVLIPGVENCRKCHGPATRENGKREGGVRHECTTCHFYHNGESPFSGVGASARGVSELKGRKSIPEFLNGK